MCYSAQVWADYRRYVRNFDARLSIEEFYDLFVRRQLSEPKIKIPKAAELALIASDDPALAEIRALIDGFSTDEVARVEQELFKQRRRLADAQRSLASKPTKAATESARIATNKVDWLLGKLSDLHRREPRDEDSRIFPQHYAPVMVLENGQRVIKPMRYQCRPAGKPANFDARFPGTYNARRDNLRGFWKDLYGYTHGVVLMEAFYENVNRHRAEGRELAAGEKPENAVLEFRPRPSQPMLAACLWSRWSSKGEPDLLSFALVTDDPLRLVKVLYE